MGPRSITHALVSLAVPLVAAACTRGPAAEPSPSPTPSSPSPLVTPTATPSPTPDPSPSPEPSEEPDPVPRTFEEDLEPAEVPADALVPKGADVTGQWFGFTDDGVVIVVAWVEPGDDPFRLPRGIAVWRRATSSPHWRTALVRRHRARAGVTEIRAQTTDVTGDGSDDALVFEGAGGSGACGRWLVIDLLHLDTSFDRQLCDGRVEPAPPASPGLVVTESVFRPGDAHCCPSAMRRTTLAWSGAAWRVTGKEITPA
jgi:hypothetical protein